VRYAYTFLGVEEPFLCRLVPTLVGEMGIAFPELVSQRNLIEKVIKEEEEAFLRTLDKGIKLMDALMVKHKDTKLISGEDTFTLYDTYGFPPDLSELIARENGYSIDIKSFEKELGKQKERSRNATSSEEGDWIEVRPYNVVEFVGYEKTEEDVQIVRYRSVKTKNKEFFQLVFDKSPFYAESGGQVGDTGFIESASGERISIVNTVKENNLNIHISEKLPKNIHERFNAKIDTGRRQSIANNHTATHLLHRALREILGTHIEQKGSLVSNSHFRFDFSHFEKVSPEVIRQVENRVNELIRENKGKDEFRDVPVEEAKSMGAMALFGEKYGDKVRVIKFGDSIELCGGTHTSATGNIGLFKIMSESAIAAGVRRIEATTGESAEKLVQGNEDMLLSVRAMFNNSPNLAGSISKLVEENENYRRQVEEFMKERSAELKIKLTEDKQYINGVNVITLKGEFHPEIIKNLAFAFKTEGNTIFIAGYEFDKKANLALMYSDDLVAHGRNAGKDIREAAKLIEGGGGGQSFFATAGGKNADGISAAIAKLIELATK